jgi:hypothetical protein
VYETRPAHGALGVNSGLIHARHVALTGKASKERKDSDTWEAVFTIGGPLVRSTLTHMKS